MISAVEAQAKTIRLRPCSGILVVEAGYREVGGDWILILQLGE